VFYYAGLSFVAAGAIRPIPGLDLSDCLFFVSLIVAVATLIFRASRFDPKLPGLFVFGFVVFSLGAVFSLPVALHATDAAGAFARFAYTTIVWFGLGALVLRTGKHVQIAVAAWIVSIAMSGLAAIAQVAFGPDAVASITIAVPRFFSRQVGLTGHPNDLGGSSAIAVAPAMLFATSRLLNSAKQLIFLGLLCLVLAAIALSGSVTSFVASFASVVVWSVGGHASMRRLATVAGMLGLMGIALVAINSVGVSSVLSPTDRVAQTLGLESAPLATGLDRLNVDAIAWNEIVRNPLFGVGIDVQSNADAMGGVGAHNMFLFTWVGAGFFGFLGLVVMVVVLGVTYVREYRNSGSNAERSLIFALGTSFLSMLLVTSAQPALYIRYGWVPAALLLPLRAMRLRGEKVAEKAARLDASLGVRGAAIARLSDQR
jgi:O-antigen ligase